MNNKGFEAYQYRDVLVRMRLGETDCAIAKSGLMGRRKGAHLRATAVPRGWLEGPLPDDATLAEVFGNRPVPLPQVPLIHPYREQIVAWREQGTDGTTIHQALVRNHQVGGSCSPARRFLLKLEAGHPQATTVLEFAPAKAGQVDFGSGPRILDAFGGQKISTWVSVLTLAFSRHQYAGIVPDQKVETWLGCRRCAFEVLWRCAPPADHRQPHVFHHPGLFPGPRGAALLRRMQGRVRLSGLPLSARGSQEEGPGGVWRQKPQAQLPAPARVPLPVPRQRTVAGADTGANRQPHSRHHQAASLDPVCRN